jgi:nucleobase:cation symporter-1, NCS1 family
MAGTSSTATEAARTIAAESGLPAGGAERTWGFGTLLAVGLTCTIATWLFPIGAAVGLFLDAGRGTAVLFGGAMIAMLIVALAVVPVSTRYGIDSIAASKPQFGTHGFSLTLLLQYVTVIGWNCLLIIILGRSVSTILTQSGIVPADAGPGVAAVASALGALGCWLILLRGPAMMKDYARGIAVIVTILGIWMLATLVSSVGIEGIAAAQPSAASGDRLWDFAAGFEITVASMMAWWPYIGGIVRLGRSTRQSMWASMLALGLAVPLLAIVGLYAGLVFADPDPTVWLVQLGGVGVGIAALVFVIVANVGTALVGVYVASVGLLQVPAIQRRARWSWLTAATLVPVAVIAGFFPNQFYDNVPTFLAFMGVLLGPVVGIQLADLYVVRRQRIDVAGLYDLRPGSPYYYVRGINPAGFVAVALGSATYLYLLNPVTFESNVPFQYVSATIPAIAVAATAYLIAYRLLGFWAASTRSSVLPGHSTVATPATADAAMIE